MTVFYLPMVYLSTAAVIYFLLVFILMQLLEKIPWEGEFILRSVPWAGLIASCGSFISYGLYFYYSRRNAFINPRNASMLRHGWTQRIDFLYYFLDFFLMWAMSCSFYCSNYSPHERIENNTVNKVSAVPLTSRSFLWALTSGSQRIPFLSLVIGWHYCLCWFVY